MTQFQKKYLWILTGGAVAYLLAFVLFNFQKNWVHPEISQLYLSHVIQNGRSLHWNDAIRAFDFGLFDDVAAPRSRFLSNFFLILNVKFRLWLFRWVAPHPSLSIMWLFTLGVIPWLLFRFVRNLAGKPEAAWIASLLYVLSTGALSVTTFQFHPGKALAHFVLVGCLAFASQMAIHQAKAASLWRWAVLSLLIFFGCFADETAWFTFAAVPLMLPNLFLKPTIQWKRMAIYGMSFPAFVAFITFAAPPLIRHFGFGNYSFWSYAVSTNENLRSYFSLSDIFKNGLNLGRDHFHMKNTGFAGLAFALVLMGWLFFRAFGSERSVRNAILCTVGTLIAFIIFQSLIMTRHLQVVGSCYYYGSLVSILFSILFALCLTSAEKKVEVLNALALFGLIVISLVNFDKETQYWITTHHVPTPSYDEVKRLWGERRDPAFIESPQSGRKYPLWPNVEVSKIWRVN